MQHSLLEVVGSDELERLSSELKIAISSHMDWVHQITAALLLGQPLESREFLSEDAHKFCKFGLWLEELLSVEEFRHTDLYKMHKPHQLLHESVAQLLERRRNGGFVDADLLHHCIHEHKHFFDLILSILELSVASSNQFDPMTKLMNRRSADSVLSDIKHQILLENSSSSSCCIALADIDNFKEVNDRFGHAIGDQVLANTAEVFQMTIRRHDTVSRYGGEEFLFIFPDLELDEAVIIVERIRKHLQESSVRSGELRVGVTASFGVTQLCQSCDITDTIKRADIALYQAKNRGRNQTVMIDNREVEYETDDRVLTPEVIKKIEEQYCITVENSEVVVEL